MVSEYVLCINGDGFTDFTGNTLPKIVNSDGRSFAFARASLLDATAGSCTIAVIDLDNESETKLCYDGLSAYVALLCCEWMKRRFAPNLLRESSSAVSVPYTFLRAWKRRVSSMNGRASVSAREEYQ